MAKTDNENVIYAAFGDDLPVYKKAQDRHRAECIVEKMESPIPRVDVDCIDGVDVDCIPDIDISIPGLPFLG